MSRLIRLDSLEPAKKQLLWIGINRTDHPLAEVMKHDPNLNKLKTVFGASFVMTQKQIEHLIQEGSRPA